MRAKVYGWHTDVYLNDEEVKEFCKPGAGADTCSWLLMGSAGWECCCLHKSHALVDRRKKGTLVAMRDGCEKVKNFDPKGLIYQEVEF